MSDGDLFTYIDEYSKHGNIAYVHFRNVRGKVPNYREVFVDEGDVDMIRALKIYRKNGYDGVVIPDHTPQVACSAPWHASMAFLVGYLRGALAALDSNKWLRWRRLTSA
jgi:mannonate dehydratase